MHHLVKFRKNVLYCVCTCVCIVQWQQKHRQLDSLTQKCNANKQIETWTNCKGLRVS